MTTALEILRAANCPTVYYLTRVVVWAGPGGALLHFPAGTIVEHGPAGASLGLIGAWYMPRVVVAGSVVRPCIALASEVVDRL